MKMFKRTIVLFLMLGDFSAMAGESGFLYNGREFVTHRDGKKVGQTVSEVLRHDRKNGGDAENRVPASDHETDVASTDVIFFQRQGGSTCFFLANHSGVSCVKN